MAWKSEGKEISIEIETKSIDDDASLLPANIVLVIDSAIKCKEFYRDKIFLFSAI